MKIIFIYRNPGQKAFSIEKVFHSVSSKIALKCDVEEKYLPSYRAKIKSIRNNLAYVKEIKGDIIHVTGDAHYVILGLPKDKSVLTIHDMVTLEKTHGLKRELLKLFWFTLPLRRCSNIIAISEKTKVDLIKMYPWLRNKVAVIPDPVDDSFQFSPKEFCNTCPRILQIGTKDNKNLYRVIDALEDLSCQLNIIGKLSDEQTQYLVKHNINYINESFLSDEEIVERYRMCDMVMFASTYEGFGLPIIEAQATGRPVITSNIEPMKTVAGAGACFVNPMDIDSIRSAVINVIGDSSFREEIVEAGRKNCVKYSTKAVAELYYRYYEKIFDQNE